MTAIALPTPSQSGIFHRVARRAKPNHFERSGVVRVVGLRLRVAAVLAVLPHQIAASERLCDHLPRPRLLRAVLVRQPQPMFVALAAVVAEAVAAITVTLEPARSILIEPTK